MPRSFLGVVLFVLLKTFPALACPLCHTSTAQQVRAGLVATTQDSSVIMAVTLPFLAIGVVVGVMNHRFFDSIGEARTKREDEEYDSKH
jgi:hypothetical protein